MTTTVPADVLRLFISEAAFLAGSKRKQLGFDKTTKRALLHNDTDDTLAMAWSDDSKQVLLAGPQTLTGLKTLDGGAKLNNNKVLTLGGAPTAVLYTDGSSTFLEGYSSWPVIIKGQTSDGIVQLANASNIMVQVDQYGATIPDSKNLFFGTSRGGRAYSDGSDTYVKTTSGYLYLDGYNAVRVSWQGNNHLEMASSVVKLFTNVDLQFGRLKLGDGSEVRNGYIPAIDDNGFPIKLATVA